jgi:hypothetical protein
VWDCGEQFHHGSKLTHCENYYFEYFISWNIQRSSSHALVQIIQIVSHSSVKGGTGVYVRGGELERICDFYEGHCRVQNNE